MADTNISKADYGNLTSALSDYSVATKQTDGVSDQDETEWMNTKWTQYLGYYKTIPELKKAVDALATWTVGKGFVADPESTVILEHITGWGEDTFNSIAWNLFVTKKIAGDAFAEVIRADDGTIINLKPLDPGTMKIIVDRYGVIKRYEQTSKTGKKEPLKFKPEDILHLCNDRVADEIHGISVCESVEWIILARNEAMSDMKKLMHRHVQPMMKWSLDTDDPAKIAAFKSKADAATANAENIFIPKGAVEQELIAIPTNATLNPLPWIQALDSFFYEALGVPKVIVGGSQEFTEATAKIAYLTFEQVYVREQQEFAADLWNQIGIRIKLNKPVSLQNELLTDEAKDQGTMAAAPQDEMGVSMQQE
jgi:hypothetical protein